MHVEVRMFILGLLGLFMHKIGLENQFWIYIVWTCFKLIVFGFGTSCLILMLFVSFLDSNMFVYGSVTG